MSLSSITPSENEKPSRMWLPVFLCICVLMVVTISAPEDFKASAYGTRSIIPPKLLKLCKTAGRGAAIVVLSYTLYLAWRRPRRWPSIKILLPMIGFVMLALVSIAWSAEKGVTLSQAGSFAMLIQLAVLISTIWNDEQDTSRILKCCSLMLGAISISLVFLHFASPRLGVLTRNSSGLFHSTNAGAAAALGVVILFSSRIIWSWTWTRWLLVPGALAHLSAMIIGANRLSAAIVAPLCLLVFVTMTRKAYVAITAVGLSIAGVLYLCFDPGLLLFGDVSERISVFSTQGQTRAELNSLSGRSEMWLKMWDSFLDQPLIGHGYFMTSKTGRIYVWGEWGNWTAHSLYLQMLVTMGIVGAILFTLGMVNILFPIIPKIGGRDRSSHRLSVFLGVIATWYLFWGVLNDSILGPLQPESVIFGVMLGLAAAIGIGRQNIGSFRAETSSSASHGGLP